MLHSSHFEDVVPRKKKEKKQQSVLCKLPNLILYSHHPTFLLPLNRQCSSLQTKKQSLMRSQRKILVLACFLLHPPTVCINSTNSLEYFTVFNFLSSQRNNPRIPIITILNIQTILPILIPLQAATVQNLDTMTNRRTVENIVPLRMTTAAVINIREVLPHLIAAMTETQKTPSRTTLHPRHINQTTAIMIILIEGEKEGTIHIHNLLNPLPATPTIVLPTTAHLHHLITTITMKIPHPIHQTLPQIIPTIHTNTHHQ